MINFYRYRYLLFIIFGNLIFLIYINRVIKIKNVLPKINLVQPNSSVKLGERKPVYGENERQTDFIRAQLVGPFYYFRCPNMNRPDNQKTIIRENLNFSFPSIFVITARQPLPPSYLTQQENNLISSKLLFINTTNASRYYYNTAEICGVKNNQSGMLFYIYKAAFKQILISNNINSSMSKKYFIFIEDDAQLLNADQFVQETYIATHIKNYRFYSYRRTATPKDGKKHSCIYEYGTVAFLIRSDLAHEIVYNVDYETACRMPIDMQLASKGPQYVSTNLIVEHYTGSNAGSRLNPL